jgi:glycosyltransferase involved in cell wall biosynthesis
VAYGVGMTTLESDPTRHLQVVIVTTSARFPAAQCAAETLLATCSQSKQVESCAVEITIPDRASSPHGLLRDGPLTGLPNVTVADAPETSQGPRERARVTLLYTPAERTRLYLPTVLLAALEANPHATVLSIPDTALVRSFPSGLFEEAAPIVLSPVRSVMVARDGRTPDEVDLDGFGAVEPDLLVVRNGAQPLLRWWAEQIGRHRFVEKQRRHHVTVPWLDRSRQFFSAHISVAAKPQTRHAWNADDPSSQEAPMLTLRNLDPARPWLLDPSLGPWARTTATDAPDLADAARRLAGILAVEPPVGSPRPSRDSGERLPGGTIVTAAMRETYEDALHHYERHGGTEPPNGFVPEELGTFLAWLSDADSHGRTRYLRQIVFNRPDLASLSPEVQLDWARQSGVAEGHSARLLGILRPAPSNPGPSSSLPRERTPGLTLVGLLKAEFGMGEAARQTLAAAQASKLPLSIVVDDGTTHRQHHPLVDGLPTGSRHDVQIVVSNADAIASVIDRYGLDGSPRTDTQRAYGMPGRPIRVGVWFWELDVFPGDRFASGLAAVDEIWTGSEFCRDAIAPAAAAHGIEVHVLPWQITAPIKCSSHAVVELAERLGIPSNRCCFVFCFDHRSVAERKNPWGVIDAFRRAFPNPTADGPVLIIKAISADLDMPGRERLRWEMANQADMILIEETLSTDDMAALMQRADAYVSLHRSEGYGLTMAEAIAAGTPVIATAYSGNMEFMTEQNSWLVPYELVDVPLDVVPYGGLGGKWAAPDLDTAAAMMREIAHDPIAARNRVAAAMASDGPGQAPSSGARFIVDRVRSLRARVAERRTNDEMPDSRRYV